jgi:hypothetical protein
MPESVISRATQKVEANSPKTCGLSDITFVFDRQRGFKTRRACG